MRVFCQFTRRCLVFLSFYLLCFGQDDAVGYDTTGDGQADAYDLDGDGVIDAYLQVSNTHSCFVADRYGSLIGVSRCAGCGGREGVGGAAGLRRAVRGAGRAGLCGRMAEYREARLC